MKILVQQNPAMLAGVSLQLGIEHDHAPPKVALGIRLIVADIPQTAAVPDFDFAAVEQVRKGHRGHYNNCMDLAALLTEQANPKSANIDRLSTEQMLRVIGAEDHKVAGAIAAEIPHIARAVDAIAAAFGSGGRLFYIGAGTSGRLGVLDASECPPTFNVPADLVQGIIAGGESALSRATETTEDDPAIGARDLQARGFRSVDILCGIAASGRTPYVLGAIDEANRIGALTIGISCTPDSELARRAKIAITPLTGPEVIAGSTRTESGYRNQDGAEYADDRRVHPPGLRARQSHGERAAEELETARPLEAHHRRGHRCLLRRGRQYAGESGEQRPRGYRSLGRSSQDQINNNG